MSPTTSTNKSERGGKLKQERMVHLALSQKAGKFLKAILESAIEEYEDPDDILEAIIKDMNDQIEKPKKKKGQKHGH